MSIYRRCAELLEAGKRIVIVTVLEASGSSPAKAGFKMLVSDAGDSWGTVGGGKLEHHAVGVARELLASGGMREERLELSALGMVCGGEVRLLFEQVAAGSSFFLFGGGHVCRALAPLIVSLGYRVTVYDSRPEAREWLAGTAGVAVVVGPYEDISGLAEEIRRARYCFIATHGHEHDWSVLRQLVTMSAGFDYVGLIGSKGKARATLERLRAAGLGRPDFLYTPVGIRIGGDTPQEIALSVAAEVVAVSRGEKVEHLRDGVVAEKS